MQASIVLENGEPSTVYLDQLIIKEDETPKRTKGILSIPKKSLVILNNTPYGVNLKYIK